MKQIREMSCIGWKTGMTSEDSWTGMNHIDEYVGWKTASQITGMKTP